MSHCCLRDLDGITTISSLKELYVAYNSLSDLSPLAMLENLQVLDLEGNDVDDLVQIQYLGLCANLQRLTLEGNPVCVCPKHTAIQSADYSYRATVRELVPQLCYLDDVRVEEDRLSCNSTMGEDWAMLRNSIRDRNPSHSATEDEETSHSGCPYSRPYSARRPASSQSCVWPLLSAGSRPHTGSRVMLTTKLGVLSPPGSRPCSADKELSAVEAETSLMTHGAGKILFCGNPIQAIRARHEKLRTAPIRSVFSPRDVRIHVPEHTYDLEEPDARECSDVFAELRAWREKHSRRLQAIETERLPQVLVIQHRNEEDEGNDEEESFEHARNDSGDEEHEEEQHSDSLGNVSPDSSFKSLSPDLYQREALSPDMAQLYLCKNTTLSPSPPASATVASRSQIQQGIRARRLRLNLAKSDHLSRVGCSNETGTTAGDANQEVKHVTGTNVPLLPHPAHIPCQPPTSVVGKDLVDSRVKMDSSSVLSGNKHFRTRQISELRNRLCLIRPHTAMAALQKYHQHHMLQPNRGSSPPD
uniref:Leucine rich repeat containing 56 n=2 Tax=Echeneis naucrates TaxID=173247 RepID=A0A665URA0_ECHNA